MLQFFETVKLMGLGMLCPLQTHSVMLLPVQRLGKGHTEKGSQCSL